MARPGERQEADNRSHKAEYGASPNGVANRWLADRKGRRVKVIVPDSGPVEGVLVAFDGYSLLVRQSESAESLVFKGPGVVVMNTDDGD
jgi:hypothetical protein